MRVLLLSKYDRLGASSRLRSYQYLSFLEQHGVIVVVAPLFDDAYVQGLYARTVPRWRVLVGYFKRLWLLFWLRSYDVLWVEKEALPWLPAVFELPLLLRGTPIVVDYDDAVFHRYDIHRSRLVRFLFGQKIDRIMSSADVVIAGSQYLIDRARRAGAKRIEKIPTVVDLDRYSSCSVRPLTGEVTIGWIGSPGTAPYLLPLITVFKALSETYRVRVMAIGAKNRPEFEGVIETVPWSETTEVALLSNIDIGIMPLPDEPFERGKCGYKLVQYMASGKPVLASPVGENSHIVRPGVNGYLPRNQAEWLKHLTELCESESLRKQMGAAGRELVEKEYASTVTAPSLLQIFNEVAIKSCLRT